MPRECIRKAVTKYTREELGKAKDRVKKGESCYEVSNNMNIPYETLRRNVKTIVWRRGSGGVTVLKASEEKLIVAAIITVSRGGFSIDRENVKNLIKQYLDETGVQTKFVDYKPGKEFILGFEKRLPELTRSRPEILAKAGAEGLSEEVVQSFFELFFCVYQSNNITDGSRIFNLDECGLNTDPRSHKDFFEKGSKNTY